MDMQFQSRGAEWFSYCVRWHLSDCCGPHAAVGLINCRPVKPDPFRSFTIILTLRLRSVTFDEFKPDGPLTHEQIAIVEKLTSADLQKIDEGLLSNCCDKWRKVARVVGTTMMSDGPYRFENVPDVFYSQRVRLLVEKGLLESQGNLDFMRYSEIRLAKPPRDQQSIASD